MLCLLQGIDLEHNLKMIQCYAIFEQLEASIEPTNFSACFPLSNFAELKISFFISAAEMHNLIFPKAFYSI